MGTRHQTSPPALLRAGFARCGGGRRTPGGGRLLPGCGASGVERSPTPDRPSFGACGRGPLPTGCGCGGCGRGDPSPTAPRALLRAGFARCGGGMRVPGGGGRLLPGRGVSRVWRSPTPTARPFGRAAGAHYPLGIAAGGVGVETRHQPHSARFCELALRAVGAAGGRPGGAPLARVWGVWGRTLSHPQPPVLWCVPPGPTTHWLWVRGVWVWGPVTNPTARCLASWLWALWGRHEGARGGGGRLLPGRGASGVGRSPNPDRSSFCACGQGPLPTGCGCRGCGCGDPSPTPPRVLLRAGFARCGGSTRAPWGGRLLPGCGWSGVGRSPTPDRPSCGACGRGPLPTGCRCGGSGRSDPSPTHSARSCELALCAVGAARGRPGGAPLAWAWGVRGPAHSDPRPPVLWGVRPEPTTHWLWVRRVRVRGPVTNPTKRALASWLCALWGRQKGARGGRLLPGCGACGVRRSPTPDHPSFGACGRGPLPTWYGCGRFGRGDPSPTPQCALLRAGFARCGGDTGVPRGAPPAWVRLVRGRALSHPRPPLLLGRAAGAHYPLAVGAGGVGVGTRHQPTARALASWLCALWGPHEGARGGRLLPGCGACGVQRSPTPDRPSFGACGRGPLPTRYCCGGSGRGDPSPTPQCALLQAGFARCWSGTRAPGGGASCVGLRPHLRRAAGARYPLAAGAVCRRWGPAVLGTFSRAAVRCVLCAPPGFAAPGGHCGLAPVLVSWFWPAEFLFGVPRGPALVRRASSGSVALGAPFSFLVAVVPSPSPGAVAPDFTGWLRGACGGRPRTGLIVPAAAPRRGKGAWRAPRRALSGPREGVVPGGSLRLPSWAAFAAVVGVCEPSH